MSRAEGYSLDLYCDREEVHPHNFVDDTSAKRFPLQYFGRNQREAYRAARRAGWRLSSDRSHDLCPVCASGRSAR